MSRPPSSPPVGVPSSYTSNVAAPATAVADEEGDGVGFERTTMLYETGSSNQSVDNIHYYSGSNSNTLHHQKHMNSAGTAAASPYALYEPMHATSSLSPPPPSSSSSPQQGVLGAVPAPTRAPETAGVLGTSSLSSSSSASILPAPTNFIPPAVLQQQQQQQVQQQRHVQQQQQHTHAYVEDGLDVPLHAPRLHVPADLPLEQTTLLDLLATLVVQGGPTTEEEIAKREMARRNPAFAFLGEKFNHPCLLYYRWRLYSLLQQDTLLTWRTAPFQVERARRAYVLVPPPMLRAGPECLAGLHQPDFWRNNSTSSSSNRKSKSSYGGGFGGVKRAREGDDAGDGDKREGEDGNEEEDIIVARKARRRRHCHRPRPATPAASQEEANQVGSAEHGRGEGSAEEGGERNEVLDKNNADDRGERSSTSSSSNSSSSESDDDDESGETQQPPEASPQSEHHRGTTSAEGKLEPAGVRGSAPVTPKAEGSQAAVAEVDFAVSLPPPSAQWISRQCIAHRHIFTVLQPDVVKEWTRLLNPRLLRAPSTCKSIEELSEAWLRRSAIAARMAFALQHADGIHHLFSVLLDGLVRTAYVATACSRAPLPPSPPTVTTEAEVDGSGAVADCTPSYTVEGDSSVYCVEALWYLFVLHDILMNASNIPSNAPSSSSPTAGGCCVNKNARSATDKQQMQGGEEAEDVLAAASNGSPEAMEALYLAWKDQQQLQQRHAASSSSPSSLSKSYAQSSIYTNTGSLTSGGNNAYAAPAAPALHTSPFPGLPPGNAVHRQRRRQRTSRRRSAYERCGDALELILPTLLESVTAVVLAVSLDKERRPQPPQPSPCSPATLKDAVNNISKEADAAAAATRASTTPRAARVHHFKVVNPFQSGRGQNKKKAAGTGDSTAEISAAPPLTGGPCLSLRFDAGCDCVLDAAFAGASAEQGEHNVTSSPNNDSSNDINNNNNTSTKDGNCSNASVTAANSSASAVLLLEWMKALVRVWMNVEQPLLLPLPSNEVPPSSTESATKRKTSGLCSTSKLRHGASASTNNNDGTAVEEREAKEEEEGDGVDEEVVGAPPPPGLLWPSTAPDASDTPEVQLAYFVAAQHAGVLGLESVAAASNAPGPQSTWAERREPPLLSARACAIVKDRYSFLF